jgi:hypothetical protein
VIFPFWQSLSGFLGQVAICIVIFLKVIQSAAEVECLINAARGFETLLEIGSGGKI